MRGSLRLYEPDSVAEAVELAAELGETARFYAGGTELLLAVEAGLLQCEALIDVKRIPELRGVRASPDGGSLAIGAAVTHRAIERSGETRHGWPLLAETEALVGNVRVRAAGTLGGNLCFAEPHSDPAVVLLLHDAVVRTQGQAGPRTLPVAEFLVDAYATALDDGEVLTAVEVPRLPGGAGATYLKFGFLERPTAGVGCVLVADAAREAIEEARLALGSVGPRPARLGAAERRLAGVPLRGEGFDRALREAAELAGQAADPVDDLHGGAAWKQALVRVLTGRAVRDARSRLEPRGPDHDGA